MSEWREIRLRRTFERPTGGTWGSDAGEAHRDVVCIRGTDFDMAKLRVDESRLPVRSITTVDWKTRRLRPGDIVVEKSGGGEQQPVGRAVLFDLDCAAVPTNFAARLRPGVDYEPRFLTYLLSSCYANGTTRSAIKQTTGIQNLDLDAFLSERVLVPAGERAQRALADYLDAETARIDALIEKKRRMIELLEERLRAMVMDQLFGADARWLRIGRTVDLLPGFAFSSELFSSDAAGGVRLLRGINVAPSQTRWDESVYIDASLAQDVQRFALAVGDLVIGMDRPVVGGGMRVAEISEADVPSLLVQRVARLRVNELAERDWIRLALMSPAFVAYFSPIVTGVSVPHISPEQIASFKLPLPEREKQRSILRRLLRVERVKNELSNAAGAQIALLREHRQALITAAVTGQLDVAKAAA